ncbi:hypothetical protein [Tropicibacter oceani]|uniref:Uncharacterized protein n=1 Tax=Tropicibacter oceani TaxID=3058420 RepID=A0ABY8QJ99_9RHOB|nr:hypothetical protein [Tropicibacter oceani]WGW04053.1 hypothetical protein QF118_00510 [Tropicibacter oceani]
MRDIQRPALSGVQRPGHRIDPASVIDHQNEPPARAAVGDPRFDRAAEDVDTARVAKGEMREIDLLDVLVAIEADAGIKLGSGHGGVSISPRLTQRKGAGAARPCFRSKRLGTGRRRPV